MSEEEELVLADGAANAHAELIDGRTWLLGDVARRVVRMKELIRCIQK